MLGIIESIKCSSCNKIFNIYEEEVKMLEKFSPSFGGKKYFFPKPKECPNCRSQKRYIWRNTNKLFRRKCDFSGEEILAFYDENVTHPVYKVEIWKNDVWNAFDYGRDFDFSRPFFEQLGKLNDVVPHYSRSIINLENSDFSNNATSLKNCYLCFNGHYGEDCYYVINFYEVKNCVDCYSIRGCENCYECTDCNQCHTVFFSQDSDDCHKSFFLKNCIACENCFGCKNLSNKKYYIFNQPYSQEKYEERIKILMEKSISELREVIKESLKKLPEKYMHERNTENISGDYINNGKNVIESFDIMDGENIFYGTNLKGNIKNLLDVNFFGSNLSNCYNSAIIGNNSSHIFFSSDCFENVNNLFYCICCIEGVKNCFACVGLKQKEYCILNKQYTKEEYNTLVPKIIEHMVKTGEWGEFFPPIMSSFAYNNSEAQNFFPIIPKEEKNGKNFQYVDNEGNTYKSLEEAGNKTIFKWNNIETPFPKVEKIIPSDKLPKNIADIPDDILNWAIKCEITQKPFRITKQELNFYRKYNLPIPKKHPDQRHIERLKLRNPRNIYTRNCDKCKKEIQTTYAPERPEIVYCEECYNKEMY